MKKFFPTLLISIVLIACNSSDDKTTIQPGAYSFDWIVPEGSVIGTFNPFPLVNKPVMTKADEIDFISEKSIVFLVGIGDEIRVYPYKYISPYECVNDEINDTKYIVTLCPITQSVLCFNSKFKGTELTFRASGYLLYDNIVAHDSKTDSFWSQMWAKSIKGQYANTYLTTINYIETDWKMVKDYFPNALVYTDSVTLKNDNNDKNKNLSHKSDNLKDNNQPYGIIQPSAKGSPIVHIYDFDDFSGEIAMWQKFIGSKNTVIIGSKKHNFITSYYVDNTTDYSLIESGFPKIMEDGKGNVYNVFGKVVAGPDTGLQLESPIAYKALWWAWNEFYSDFKFNQD